MHIRRVDISNVRCLREVSLDFELPGIGTCAGWTVFAGPNGTGKTTLLQAIAVALLGEGNRFLENRLNAWIRWDEQGASVIPDLGVSDDDRFEFPADPQRDPASFEEMRRRAEEIQATRAAVRVSLFWGRRRPHASKPILRDYSVASQHPDEPYGLDFVDGGPWSWQPEGKGWFASGYGAHRQMGQSTQSEHDGSELLRHRGFATLFRSEALLESVAMLQQVNYRAISDDGDDDARHLAQRIEKCSIDLLQELLSPRGVEVRGVGPDGLRVWRDGREIRLKQLSDGFQAIASMVLDIVLRIGHAFGERFRFEKRDGRTTVPHSGVVLIDEVEEHLHPTWQRDIGFWLTERFPGVQFLVTTHSPFVCQAASPGGLIRLPASGEDRQIERVSDQTYAAVVNGTLDDAILSDLFGMDRLYSPRTERLRDQVAELEVKTILGTASEAEVEEYHSLASQLPTTDTSAVEQSLRKLDHLR